MRLALHRRRAAHGDFCEPACRKAWNNRRMVRGAEFYDLFMALRFERGPAKLVRAWTMICRMAATFRAEDVEQRDGRKSWRRPAQVAARHPYLHAIVMASGINGGRRS